MASESTPEQHAACIDDLIVNLKHLGKGSKLAICLCKNEGQVYQGQSSQLDANQLKQFEEVLQQFFDSQYQVNEPSDTEYQKNKLAFERRREMSRESPGSQGQVNRRYTFGIEGTANAKRVIVYDGMILKPDSQRFSVDVTDNDLNLLELREALGML